MAVSGGGVSAQGGVCLGESGCLLVPLPVNRMTDKLQHGYDALTLNQNKQYKEPTTTATTGRQLLSYLLWDAAIIETSLCENSKHLHVWAVIASLSVVHLNIQYH